MDRSDPGDSPANPEGRDLVDLLAEEFVGRQRRGESPSVEEYAQRCPDRAEEIRSLFPAIASLERLKPPIARPSGRPARVPERLGDCRLIREIGRGGMGIVFEAEQESLGRRVAVKVLPRSPFADDRPLLRFLREASTAASLQHPRIVPIFGVGEDDGHSYYIMQLIPGLGLDRVLQALRARADRGPETPANAPASVLARTLAEASAPKADRPIEPSRDTEPDWLPDGPEGDRGEAEADLIGPIGPDDWRGVARIGSQAGRALQHAHDRGILHRDIKPANLILDRSGDVWMTDFGLAKALGQDDLSRSGDLLGTIRYMAPERLRGLCDPRSDVYSLGLTLYEILTLRPALECVDGAALIRKIAEDRPESPRSANPRVPIDLETIILKAIAADPSARYPAASALADDLDRFLDGLPILGRRPTPPERLARWVRRSPALAALSGISLGLGVVAAVFVTLFLLAPPPPWDDRPEGPPPIPDGGEPPKKDRRPPPKRGPHPPGKPAWRPEFPKPGPPGDYPPDPPPGFPP